MKRLRSSRSFRLLTLVAALLLTGIGALAVNAPVIAAWWYSVRHGLDADRLPAAAALTADDRVLVVAPHPDDEVLCCAGMIQAALAAGGEVWVVYLTSGDGFELDAIAVERTVRPRGPALVSLGLRRMQEARDGAAVLGLDAESLIFLGFPDRGLREIYRLYIDEPYRSPFTGQSTVPYAEARTPGAPYTGEQLLEEMRGVFDEVAPTVVLAPTPLDAHPDHRITGEITLRLLFERDLLGNGLWWIVHGDPEWPLPKGVHRGAPLFPPVRARALPWQRVDLSGDQVDTKLTAIRAHTSQITLLRRFLESFAKRNELLSPQALPGPR